VRYFFLQISRQNIIFVFNCADVPQIALTAPFCAQTLNIGVLIYFVMDKHVTMTPDDEARMIDEAYQDLLNGYLKSNHRKKVEIIDKAFKFAREAHKGVRRRSGEPYIMHPIAVAKIASQEIGLGSTSICAALLHDVVEDTDYTVEDIEQHFGKNSTTC
jgi:hypothetical protein